MMMMMMMRNFNVMSDKFTLHIVCTQATTLSEKQTKMNK